MNNIKTGYKLARIMDYNDYNDKVVFDSLFADPPLRYTFNKKTYRKISDGAICLFDTEEHAQEAYYRGYIISIPAFITILECEYKEEGLSYARAPYCVYDDTLHHVGSGLLEYPLELDALNDSKNIYDAMGEYSGTLYARWVKPVGICTLLSPLE